MSRGLIGTRVMVFCAAVALASGSALASGAARAENRGISPTPAPESVSDGSGNLFWTAPIGFSGGKGVTFRASCSTTPTLSEGKEIVAFLGNAVAAESLEDTWARVVLRDASGAKLFAAELALPLSPGDNRCRFELNAISLPYGVYAAHFEIVHRPDRTMASADLAVTKSSRDRMGTDIGRAAQEIEALNDLLATTASKGTRPSYAQVRHALAQDVLPQAQAALAREDWARAGMLAGYVSNATVAVRAELARETAHPEYADTVPDPPMDQVVARDGGFYAGGRPVFLFGALGGAELAGLLPRLRSYGLNAAVTNMSPAMSLADNATEADLARKFDPLFQSVAANNFGAICSLEPQDIGALSEADKRGQTQTNTDKGTDAGAFPFDLTLSKSRDLLQRHMQTTARYLKGQSAVRGICLVSRPEFEFRGEGIRAGFEAQVRADYPSREEVNRAWRKRLRTLDEIDIWPKYARQAYQYDWQTYHQKMGTDFVSWMKTGVQREFPGAPVMTVFGDTAFTEKESRDGVDHEGVAALMDIVGAACSFEDNDASNMSFPGPGMLFSLLRSIAPDKPAFNIDYGGSGDTTMTTDSFAALYAGLWEAAISGMNGCGLRMQGPDGKGGLLDSPERLRAYATACLDLNRLAPIVMAFQQAPTEVAILWSKAAKIFDDGRPYLASVRQAFEGSSFCGRTVRFVTEKQCAAGALAKVKMLVLPDAPAVADATFTAVEEFAGAGGTVVRLGRPIPYDVHGASRRDVPTYTVRTVLLRGNDSPTSFLHAMDAAQEVGQCGVIPRAINQFGYALEGVKTRHVQYGGESYLYLVNVRRQPVSVCLDGELKAGRDLIRGRDVQFPCMVNPLDPMLLRLGAPGGANPRGEKPVGTVASGSAAGDQTTPSAALRPLPQPKKPLSGTVKKPRPEGAALPGGKMTVAQPPTH